LLGEPVAAMPVGQQTGGGLDVGGLEWPHRIDARSGGHGGESYRHHFEPQQTIDDRWWRAYSRSIPTPVRARTRPGVGEPYANVANPPISMLPKQVNP